MSEVSTTLRRAQGSYFHWCPGCDEMHPLPDRWQFDGNLASPTFSPSFKHTLTRFDAYTADGLGIGEQRDVTCHYILTAGVLNYCPDSWHALAGTAVPLPELPAEYRDFLDSVTL